MKRYQSEEDFRRIRSFLREIFILNNRRMLSWPVARWDYWRWHGIMNMGDGSLEKDVYLWENESGDIAAVLNREGSGQAFLQVHPSYKNIDLEAQMISTAEEELKASSRRGGQYLWIWCDAQDNLRQEVLSLHGFVHREDADEQQWLRDLSQPISDSPVRQGYIIRSLVEASELPSRSWASWRAFHPDEPDEDYNHDWSWYLNIQKAPLYRQDLDMVCISPKGEIVAFTTIWYEEETKCGYFEPVGTMPEHQRLGLGRSLLCEGMRRLKDLGATQVMTIGGEPPANGLYQSVLGPIFDISQPWEKRWI